jgi:hypothetical protein
LSSQILLRVSRGPMQTEIWWSTFFGKQAPPERKAEIVEGAIHSFGPAGFLEQGTVRTGRRAPGRPRETPARRSRGCCRLRRGKVEHDSDGLDPPYIECSINEHGQLWTFASWVH